MGRPDANHRTVDLIAHRFEHPRPGVVNRDLERNRGIKAVIPQRGDEVGQRLRRGSAGGRLPAFDPSLYKGRNIIERSFNDRKQWRGIATRYDKLAAGPGRTLSMGRVIG
jgi:transposase